MAVGRIKRVLRWLLFLALAVFAGLQLRTVQRTNPPVVTDIEAPTEITAILRRACYNCHSNETHWPWYSYVAPFSWWLVDHVEEGRSEMNFSEWPADLIEREMIYKDIDEQVGLGKMPLKSYRIMHSGARLSEDERNELRRWARGK